jgi:hypothetical protein
MPLLAPVTRATLPLRSKGFAGVIAALEGA